MKESTIPVGLSRMFLICLLTVMLFPGQSISATPADGAPGSWNILQPDVVQGPPPDTPVVFVCRNRLAAWNGVHVGPPVDVAGRELTPGGRLMLWRPDGTVTDLTADTGLFDVQQPDVSFDATKVVFSAVTGPRRQWHLWEMGLDGSGLRQLTFDDRDIPIPQDPLDPERNNYIFGRYGDFGPVYLPDGRILFSSTRYMTLSGSCGQRGQNLYVLNTDTLEIRRRTTERAGAMDPYVLKDGRIVFSHWIDAMNTPALDGPGLRPLEADYNFAPSFWGIWVMNPDAGEAGRYAFLRGGLEDGGGAHQPHELPDGRLAVTVRQIGSLLGDTLANAVTITTPGPVEPHSLSFLGDPFALEGPHALGPAPLSDGRMVVSYTSFTTIETDELGLRRADFDFGLYVVDETFSNLALLYNDPKTDELDAVIVSVRSAPVIEDQPDADVITDDPTVDPGATATLMNHNVYADLSPDTTGLPSPRIGTVTRIDVYDDSQTFTTSEEFPLVRKQMPRLVGSFPVDADGAFEATVPADRALLFVLVNQDGIAVRSPLSLSRPAGKGEGITHSFNGHDYLRPGAVLHCTGCHKGHMFQPDLAMEARANLARLATATASSEAHPFWAGAWRVNDLRLANDWGGFSWADLGGPEAWVQLDWPMTVEVGEVVLYPLTKQGAQVTSAVMSLSNGTNMGVGPFPDDESPMTIEFEEPVAITWLRFTVERSASNVVGLAEIAVHGAPSGVIIPDLTPPAPVNLRTTEGVVFLHWDRNLARKDEPSVAGYRVYYGTETGTYEHMLDAGNVTDVLVRDRLEDGVTYYFAVKSYNVHGTESEGFSNEVSATVVAPVVTRIEPNHGPIGGGTVITITGDHFAPGGVRVMLGPVHAYRVQVLDEKTITAVTHWYQSGPVDVSVSNPDDLKGVLDDGFTYDKPRAPAVQTRP